MTRTLGILSGKGGVGKCVHPDTPIITETGEIFNIGSLFEKCSKNPKKVILDQEGIFVEPKDPLNIISMDKNLKLRPKRAKYVYKGFSKCLFKISTKQGREIRVTPEHKFFILKNNNLEWIKAKDLDIGDFVSVPRIIELNKKESRLLEKFSNNILIKIDNNFRNEIKKNIVDILEHDERIRYKILCRILKKKPYFVVNKNTVWANIRRLEKLGVIRRKGKLNINVDCDKLVDHYMEGIPVETFKAFNFKEEMIDSFVYENKFYKRSSFVDRKILGLDKELVDFISVVIAEGNVNKSIISVSNKDIGIINKVRKICDKFKLKYEISHIDGKFDAYIKCGVTFTKILEDVFEIPYNANRKSFKIKVPNVIINSNFLNTYLSTYIDCDGYLPKTRPTIEITSASKENIIRLGYVFLEYGVNSSIKSYYSQASNSKKPKKRKYYDLVISGNDNINKLRGNIVLESQHKSRMYNDYKNIKSNSNIDFLPLGMFFKDIRTKNNLFQRDLGNQGSISDYENERNMPSFGALRNINMVLEKHRVYDSFLGLITKSDLFFDRVAKIEVIEHNGFVYDLTIDDTHNFVAGEGAFISHNTSTSVNIGAAFNYFGRDVVVVDGNLSTPNLGLHLGVPIVPISLHDVLKGKNHLSEAVYLHESGLKIVPAGLSLQDLMGVNPEKLKKVLPGLHGVADVVVVDGAAGLGREALAVMNSVDDILIVTNPELPAMTDALKMIKLAEKAGKNVLGVVVTRTGEDYDISFGNINSLLEKPILADIPNDKAMRKSLIQKEPVIYAYPKSKSAIAYKKLAASLIGMKYDEKVPGFFSRLFGRN